MIKLRLNKLNVIHEHLTFSGGEEQVKIKMCQVPKGNIGYVDIYAHLKSSQDVMHLVMLSDAVRRLTNISKNTVFTLHMPYIPYARQDRVMEPGEALALKSFSIIINGLGFDQLVVDDPHSNVSDGVFENLLIRPQHELFKELFPKGFPQNSVIISPDAGARKKAQKVAELYGFEVVEAGKVRDTKTGDISGTAVYGDVEHKCCIIVDDIADYGNTFKALGAKLKSLGAKNVILYVTHGIFAGGIDTFEGMINEIYCYHPWMDNIEGRNNLGIFRNRDMV